jgi:hypothetical protein
MEEIGRCNRELFSDIPRTRADVAGMRYPASQMRRLFDPLWNTGGACGAIDNRAVSVGKNLWGGKEALEKSGHSPSVKEIEGKMNVITEFSEHHGNIDLNFEVRYDAWKKSEDVIESFSPLTL